ncbi:MAG: XRE family transcriptional regulator [Bacteroidales bacterium]|nr:XRE family transcriptional regulator [Bacteroidales bacterium]
MEKDFHTGHLIREVLDRQKRSVSWLAREIQCERTTCYDIFERKFVNTEQLEKISIALRHNFFRDLADYEEGVVKNHTQV